MVPKFNLAAILTLGVAGAAHALMPLSLMDNEPAAPKESHNAALWGMAGPMLQAALECREDLPNHPLITALLLPAAQKSGAEPDYRLTPPSDFTVFGLPVAEIEISLYDKNEGAGYSSIFRGLSLAKVGKAANLTDGDSEDSAYRQTEMGGLWAAQPEGPEWTRLTCVILPALRGGRTSE